jgi:hypothetical protein
MLPKRTREGWADTPSAMRIRPVVGKDAALRTRSLIGFDPNLMHLSVVEREHDHDPIHQLAVHRKRPILPLLHAIRRRQAIDVDSSVALARLAVLIRILARRNSS